ncbi:MAG: glycosyltransferase family 2 protein [Roseibium sp.]
MVNRSDYKGSTLKVSVIVPIYNAERYLSETIESVLDQNFPGYELILVDDGSTDSTAKICRSFKDDRIVYVRQNNQGVSAARNTGLGIARGEIIGFLDSDDLWHREKIAEHVAHFDRIPNLGVSYDVCRFINANGTPMKTMYRPKMANVSAADVFCRNPLAGGSSGFFRRIIFNDIIEPRSNDGRSGYFDIKATHGEDHQCWLRMALHSALRFQGIDRELTYYRIHDGGQSAKVDKMYQGWTAIDAMVREIDPDLHTKYSKLANAYQMRYFARRLIARGDGREAMVFLKLMHNHSLKPYLFQPLKTIISLAAAFALIVVPNLSTRVISGVRSTRRAR